MNHAKGLIDSFKKFFNAMSSEGGLPAKSDMSQNRQFLTNEELPEVADDIAMYNVGYMADKQMFCITFVDYKQTKVV